MPSDEENSSIEPLDFGVDISMFISSLGEAHDIYTEDVGGRTVTSYVFYIDYTNLTVVQVLNDKVSGVMTFDTNMIVNYSSLPISISSFFDSAETKTELQNNGYSVTLYTEEFNNNRIFAYYISKGYNYSFNKINEVTVQEQLVFHFSNAIRAMNYQDSIQQSAQASQAARLHSKDMADNSFFGHTSSDGRELNERLLEQNIEFAVSGENICRNYSNAFDGVTGLYNSASHRIVLLSDRITYIGIGCAKSSSGFGYITQDFYSPTA